MEFKDMMGKLSRAYDAVYYEHESSPFEGVCGDSLDMWLAYCAAEPEDAEARIRDWHPEVVYPTIGEVVEYMVGHPVDDWDSVKDMEVPVEKAHEFDLYPLGREYIK